MEEQVARYPELKVFRNDADIPDKLYLTDPDRCCEILKVEPTRQAVEQMNVSCWVTGLRCTEGRTRTDYREVEQRDPQERVNLWADPACDGTKSELLNRLLDEVLCSQDQSNWRVQKPVPPKRTWVPGRPQHG